MKEKIKKAYETLADQYNARIDHKPHNAYYDRPNTLALLGKVKGMHILDAACGPGKYAEELFAKGAEITGFDISPKMIAHAKARNPGAGYFFVHDFSEPLNMLEDGSFDAVVCGLALHYAEDWNAIMGEFYRLLKPMGTLVISVEHPFFEYTYFNSKKYFEVEAVSAEWRGFGVPVTVPSYRRSLQQCIDPLVKNGFYIDALVEPKPLPQFEQIDPKHFKELNEFPAFMCIRAQRK